MNITAVPDVLLPIVGAPCIAWHTAIHLIE